MSNTIVVEQHDTAKLPKWAQNRIHNLEQRIAELEDKTRVEGEEKTDLYWYKPLFGNYHYLPDEHTYIVFKFHGVHLQQEITINRDGEGLRISSTCQLSISPRASNTVNVTLIEP